LRDTGAAVAGQVTVSVLGLLGQFAQVIDNDSLLHAFVGVVEVTSISYKA
jgi:hypothetical protein